MDEAGLPAEERESLKVLHYYLEDHMTRPAQVGFIAITNHVLDAAKSNRCAILLRAEPDRDELLQVAWGCLEAPEGTAEQFIWDGDNTYGGKVVTNPSGGLLSKGHPLGATGLAQCTELVWQLRGDAGDRQVEGATHALQHNLGLGGACVVTMYSND